MTTRDIMVAGAIPRQQVRSYLRALKLEWQERKTWDATCSSLESTFTVPDATEAQWGQIQEWVRKVTG